MNSKMIENFFLSGKDDCLFLNNLKHKRKAQRLRAQFEAQFEAQRLGLGFALKFRLFKKSFRFQFFVGEILEAQVKKFF